MSELQRSVLSARIAKLPPSEFLEDDEEEFKEEGPEADDSLKALPGSGMGPPAMPSRQRHSRNMASRGSTGDRTRSAGGAAGAPEPNPEFAPLSASSFFAEAAQVSLPKRGLDCRVYHTPASFADGTVMVCHHGAGYSGLTFACFAAEVKQLTNGECGVLAFDARAHGKTMSVHSEDRKEEDLSIDVLVEDFVNLICALFPDPSTAPSLLLIGHSMGGSVLVRSCPVLLGNTYRVTGVAVIDVVEGSAIDALPHMHSLLNARPEGFQSVEDAIEWHLTTNTIRNPNSARISIPAIVLPNDLEGDPSSSATVLPYKWRTPLRSTAPYWMSWFKGLSSSFLAARTARVLVLAGTERLDKELMIGQMQGKFQLVVIPSAGHMLQEDDPTKFAEAMVEFWRRNEKVVVGMKRVGDL